MQIKLNRDLAGYRAGNIIKIKSDNNNIPLNQYWRRRLEEAKLDSAIEIIQDKKSKKTKTEKKLERGTDDSSETA